MLLRVVVGKVSTWLFRKMSTLSLIPQAESSFESDSIFQQSPAHQQQQQQQQEYDMLLCTETFDETTMSTTSSSSSLNISIPDLKQKNFLHELDEEEEEENELLLVGKEENIPVLYLPPPSVPDKDAQQQRGERSMFFTVDSSSSSSSSSSFSSSSSVSCPSFAFLASSSSSQSSSSSSSSSSSCSSKSCFNTNTLLYALEQINNNSVRLDAQVEYIADETSVDSTKSSECEVTTFSSCLQQQHHQHHHHLLVNEFIQDCLPEFNNMLQKGDDVVDERGKDADVEDEGIIDECLEPPSNNYEEEYENDGGSEEAQQQTNETRVKRRYTLRKKGSSSEYKTRPRKRTNAGLYGLSELSKLFIEGHPGNFTRQELEEHLKDTLVRMDEPIHAVNRRVYDICSVMTAVDFVQFTKPSYKKVKCTDELLEDREAMKKRIDEKAMTLFQLCRKYIDNKKQHENASAKLDMPFMLLYTPHKDSEITITHEKSENGTTATITSNQPFGLRTSDDCFRSFIENTVTNS